MEKTTKQLEIELKERIETLRREISYISQMRGGGDTVVAGTNVSFSIDSNGNKVISSSGGGGSVETPTGTVNGSNTVFTVLNTPLEIIADGATYFEGAGYSRAVLTITMDTAPSQFIRSKY